jgi:hypothetical protein
LELKDAFLGVKGDVYLGDEAWAHLEDAAGPVMAAFLDKYVKLPLADILHSAPIELPTMAMQSSAGEIRLMVGQETLTIQRKESPELATPQDAIPDDADSGPPSP